MSIQWRDVSSSADAAVEWKDLPPADDYYEMIEVSPRASPEVIKRAYRTLIERYHPDKHPPERRPWAEEMTKQLNGAYAVLSNAERRAEYDRRPGVR
jgi:DnaJ-class molecular chaperone